MNKLREKANRIFKNSPELTELYLTEDGQAFFNQEAARNHVKYRGLKNDPHPFFPEKKTSKKDNGKTPKEPKASGAKEKTKKIQEKPETVNGTPKDKPIEKAAE